MDSGIEFGEVEETPPQVELRPDRNHHYAVVPYGKPNENDLPVFLDADVLRDMELHALSDTAVELGGVLLGGQYQDEEGRPFVVVSDSLRAEHYENTKGSFKFTHETWSAISRQRDLFPPELQMVGWYHTHPGWGVFLSGMDTFICDHFFSRPLDVALVIDPCQQHRSFFQWVSGAPGELRETGGFYVIGSRFREWELQSIVEHLERRMPMPSHSSMGPPAPAGSPVIHVSEPRSVWMPIIAGSMLMMQFLLVALIAWRLILPPTAAYPAKSAESRQLAAERAMLDKVIGKLQVAPEGVVESMEKQRLHNEELEAANVGLMARVREIESEYAKLDKQQSQSTTRIERLRNQIDLLAEKRDASKNRIADLENELKSYRPEGEKDPDADSLWARIWRWKWYAGAALLLLFTGIIVAVLFGLPNGPNDSSTDAPGDESTNSEA